MKFVFLGLLLCGHAGAVGLNEVRSVYVYPMAGGFDQHLVNRLIGERVFRMVTDPKLADAVMTDQVGAAFLYKLDHINPPAAPPAPPAAGQTQAPAKEDTAPHQSSFAANRGSVFLVDLKSKEILWSAFERPKNMTAREMERTAKRVVMDLALALGMGKAGKAPELPPVMPAPATPAPAPPPAPAAPAPAPPKPAPPK